MIKTHNIEILLSWIFKSFSDVTSIAIAIVIATATVTSTTNATSTVSAENKIWIFLSFLRNA